MKTAENFFARPGGWQSGCSHVWGMTADCREGVLPDTCSFLRSTCDTTWNGFAYKFMLDGKSPPPEHSGNYLITIFGEVVYVGMTTDIFARCNSSGYIDFARQRLGFGLWWLPYANWAVELYLRRVLKPEWNGTHLKELRPFHDCGTVQTGRRCKCTVRYTSSIHTRNPRNLWSISGKPA